MQYLKYLEVERGASPATLVAYRTDFDQFLPFLDDSKPADERRSRDNLVFFTAEALRDFQYYLADRRFASASIARKLAVLSGFGRWLEDWDHLAKNPARRLPRPKKPRAIRRHLSLDEYRRVMLLPLSRRDALLRGLLSYAGLRRAEIVGLKVADARVEERRLPTGVTVSGYLRIAGRRGPTPRRPRPSGGSRPTVPFREGLMRSAFARPRGILLALVTAAVIGLSAASGWAQNVSVGPASSAGAGVPLAVAGGADTGISFYALAPVFTGGVSVRTGP